MKRFATFACVCLFGGIIGALAVSFFRPLTPINTSGIYQFYDELAANMRPLIFAKGIWISDRLAARANSVQITCELETRECTMLQADVHHIGDQYYLQLSSSSFKVTSVSAATVEAEDATSAMCVRQVLRFDRRAKQVLFIRTKSRNDGPCAAVDDEPLTLTLSNPLDQLKARLGLKTK